MHRGFSLVELSIVLVILGLLTGGILAGQSLIRASELRAVTTEYQRYSAAIHTFRDKYFAVPGDFRDATRFWGRMNTNADCASNSGLATASAPGACDGGGDGVITASALTAGISNEAFQFWRHLALAGLIEGEYTGLTAFAHNVSAVRGTNSPASKVNDALWAAWFVNMTGSSAMFQYNFGNSLVFSGANPSSWPTIAVLKIEDAWNIDTKLDDGHAANGKVWAVRWSNCTIATSETDFQSYKLDASTTNGKLCSLIFHHAF